MLKGRIAFVVINLSRFIFQQSLFTHTNKIFSVFFIVVLNRHKNFYTHTHILYLPLIVTLQSKNKNLHNYFPSPSYRATSATAFKEFLCTFISIVFSLSLACSLFLSLYIQTEFWPFPLCIPYPVKIVNYILIMFNSLTLTSIDSLL